ncbi:ABC transporter permease [Mycolicibacterium septicum DSM 44393]|uniref:ABC transporter permease n=2 Tax=Mycolicibacterium septicum TaxID=98668 RepID=A0A7X6MMF3_9MYCO|nr:ABC transporter permease [Mycolicibacterium septicum]NKZ10813.1 ABC transporter permease [Mycolicibacterium septicum DSM 44393]
MTPEKTVSVAWDGTEASPRWRELLRRPTFVISAGILVFWISAAIGWRWIVDPFSNSGTKFGQPSVDHPFGTDFYGRDVLARVLAGAEPAMLVGPAGAVLAAVAATLLGLTSGYFRGPFDALMMRVFDVFLVLPPIIMLIVVVSAVGASPPAMIVIVAIVYTPTIARIIRAAVLTQRDKPYVAAARLQGEGRRRIMVTEILPNILPTVVVQAVLNLGYAIFVISSLSFLGLAAQPPSPDWGLAISDNRLYLQTAWWTLAFPAASLASVVISVMLFADNLKEVYDR